MSEGRLKFNLESDGGSPRQGQLLRDGGSCSPSRLGANYAVNAECLYTIYGSYTLIRYLDAWPISRSNFLKLH